MSVGMLALKLTVTGMGTVFVILGVLGLIMHCFKYLFNSNKQTAAVTCPPACCPAGTEANEELVAVVAAATHYARLKFKRPVLVKAVTPHWDTEHESTWQAAGRRELQSTLLDLRGVK
ncbi:MAG: Oxaloacetate decarboxylase, gamma chain [Firmicutes bacterium ADurb.Bin456]|nr:MAG: Oxaloacetate decarboxylase, gamma chain [Firmicutes bacterium ADurb.Bin456]